jgi:capsular exopolysaccharide synthesis family protein
MNTTKAMNGQFSLPTRPAIPWQTIYNVLMRRAWLITACILLAGILGVAYLAYTPKIYASTTTVQVEQQNTKVIDIQSVTPEDASTAELLKTIEQNFMSKDLLLRVIKVSGLANDPRFLPVGVKGPLTDDALLNLMNKAVIVKLRRGSRLIDITVQHTNPEAAHIIAQTMVKEYLRQGFEERVSMARMANEFLLDEANRLKAKVEMAERAVQDYREKQDAGSLAQKQDTVEDALKDINSRYTDARGMRLKLEAEFAQAQTLLSGPVENLLAIPSVASSPLVMDSKKQVADKQVEIALLAQRYRSEHPIYIQAVSQLHELQKERDERIRKAVQELQTEYAAAQATEKRFQEALVTQQKQALELTRIAIPYNTLTRDVESEEAMYEAVLKRLKETEVDSGLNESNIRLVESARVPRFPVSPVMWQVAAVALLTGSVIGVGMVAALHLLDSSMRTVDEAETTLELAAWAAIPNNSKLKRAQSPLVVATQPETAMAEAFRTLRTSLSIKSGQEARVLLFTSAVQAEGKSFCSANAAVAFAQMGLKTLIIDADLRRPSLGKMFNFGLKTAGLTEHLEKGAALSELFMPTEIPGLHLLTAGSQVRNPAELLRQGKLDAFFSDPILKEYDRIVIDSAPVNAVSDSLNLVRFAQSVCLVLRANKTSKRAIVRAYQELLAAGAKTVGLVVNRLPKGSGAGYYYYYSMGAYGNEGVYGARKAMAA